MRYILLTTFLLALIFQSSNLETYNLVKLTDPNALCLDGSPGAHYLSKGDPDKVILYF